MPNESPFRDKILELVYDLDAELEAIAIATIELSAADFSELVLQLPQLTREDLAARLKQLTNS